MKRKHFFKTNDKIGRLTLIDEGPRARDGHRQWNTVCDCGTNKIVCEKQLIAGTSKSCGCLQRELGGRRSTRHGLSAWNKEKQSYLYITWNSIIQRTQNPNNHGYAHYGARGIGLHPEWRFDFKKFLIDIESELGIRPSKDYSLDRINNDAGYIPGNLRWATRKQQKRNSRTTKMVTFMGIQKPQIEWAETYGIPASILSARLTSGWEIRKALETPVRYKATFVE